MNRALELIAPLLVFVALMRCRANAKRRTLRLFLTQGGPDSESAVHAAPLDELDSTSQAEPVLEDGQSGFEELRGAMEHGDVDLFAPLRVALVDLVRVGRSLGDRRNEHEFAALEARLPGFEIIAGMSRFGATVTDVHLQKLLRAISVVAQRVWNVFGDNPYGVMRGQALKPQRKRGEIKGLLQLLLLLLDIFQFDDSVCTDERLDRVHQRLFSPPLKDETNYRALASNTNYISGNGHATNNNWAINIIRIVKEQEVSIRTIASLLGDRVAFEAADDTQPSAAGCMIGTRTRVLTKFIKWAINDSKRISWLTGMAGTGKSSIALTLCRMLRNEPAVFFGGGFFCSRSSGSIAQTDVRRIIPTLARIMAGNSSEFATALAVELCKADRIAFKPVREQIEPLLFRPLSALSRTSRPIVFVIDALDELRDGSELAQLLGLIADFQTEISVKFILTSRPEMHIRGTPISNPDHNTILKLHSIDPVEVKQDICRYIEGTLVEATNGSATWYTSADVGALVELSDCLFIFASTAIKYVLDPDDDVARSARLRRATSTVAQGTAATARLDAMYELVVTGASDCKNIDTEELEELKSILACILASRSPLTVQALAELVKLEPGILRSSLRRLHAVVHVPDDNEEPGLHTVHASFGDYLFGRASNHIRISRSLGHSILARACLDLMSKDLRFNVSQSASSYQPNRSTKPDSITLSLEYACLHWAHHIDTTSTCSNDPASKAPSFDMEIGQIFRPKFLSWLEVLSILRKVGMASGLLLIAGSAVNDPVVLQFLSDANSFVASSHEAIERSVPHIYLSALPFADKNSLVYRDFFPHFTGLVSVDSSGIGDHGGSAVMTLTGCGGAVHSVAYSPDGRLLVSGSEDGAVRVWDTRTGVEAIIPLRSGDGPVLSVDFSGNNKWVASGTEAGTVYVWNIIPGQQTHQRLSGHHGRVNSVVFSPDSSRLASASNDKTVHLWDPETGGRLIALSGHKGLVSGIAFSADGEILASRSRDETIRFWHSTTGAEAHGMIFHAGYGSVALSPDGKIVAGTFSNAVVLWLCKSGEKIAVLDCRASNYFVRFSPNGRSLVAAHERGVRVWALQPDLSNSPRVDHGGHSKNVCSAAFSPDGRHIASASDDYTIRIWSAGSGQSTVEPLPAHFLPVNSVAVSPNGAFIVSGSEDKSVRVWDAHTGEAKLPPLLGHTDWVLSVAISPDGRLIASTSGFWDRTVRLWNAQSGAPVGELMHGHTDDIRAVTFSSDGCWLASACDDRTVRLWEVATRHLLAVSPLKCNGSTSTVAFSPNGRLVAAGDSWGQIYIWKTETGEPLHETIHGSDANIYSLAFSPDSTRIVFGGVDKAVYIWDISARKQILALQAHNDTVRSVAWSSNGDIIGIGSDDRTLSLWDAVTGALLTTLHGHSQGVRSVTFATGKRSIAIVSGSGDSTIRRWDVDVACKSALEHGDDPATSLASATLDDGWLVGSSGELLLWVPAEYRGYLQAARCTMWIDRSRIIIRAGDSRLHVGLNWTLCWKNRDV